MTGRAILRLSPIALLVVVAACGGSSHKIASRQISERVYLVRSGKIAPVARKVPAHAGSFTLLSLALSAGPTHAEREAGFTTALSGTNLFKAPKSRLGLAQLVFTLSQLDPSAPVTIARKSYTRADFEDETPIILVESPLPFAHVTSPLRVTGTANTFEATFDYDLVGADGKVLAHHFVTATSGNGVRGTFAFTARFSVAHEQQGKLLVYELSAKDGSRIHQSEIPLTLEP